MREMNEGDKNVVKGVPEDFMSENGKLLLYNAFPRDYGRFADLIEDLERIGSLGFNAVWINPLTPTSTKNVKRLNLKTSEMQEVTGSLYAATDFSRLNSQLFPDLDDKSSSPEEEQGNPGYSTELEKLKMTEFTGTAKRNGMKPLFDLVLAHVAKDSPLVSGKSPYFLKKGIDTSKWFAKESEKWDDITPFDYGDETIRHEIIEHLWKPYIKKYVEDFGFRGVRVDYAEGFKEADKVEKILLDELKKLVQDYHQEEAIIFAEVLPPNNKILEKKSDIKTFRELYTHVTNNSLFTLDKHQDRNIDMGIKQKFTHLNMNGSLKNNAGGTVGFASSHDNGPNARNALNKSQINQKISEDSFRIWLYNEASDQGEQAKQEGNEEAIKHYKRQHESVYNSAITATLMDIQQSPEKTKETWFKEQKRRLAICALVSDGGVYVSSGDEFGISTPKSVFQKTDGKSLYNESTNFKNSKYNPECDNTELIYNLNLSIKDKPRSKFFHWSRVLLLEDDLVAVINYNDEGYKDLKPELTLVNLNENRKIKFGDTLFEKLVEKNLDFETTEYYKELCYTTCLKANIKLVGNFGYGLSERHQNDVKIYNNQVLTKKKVIQKEDKDIDELTNEVVIRGTGQRKPVEVVSLPLIRLSMFQSIENSEKMILKSNELVEINTEQLRKQEEEFLIEHRHDNAELQHEYDKRFGMILK